MDSPNSATLNMMQRQITDSAGTFLPGLTEDYSTKDLSILRHHSMFKNQMSSVARKDSEINLVDEDPLHTIPFDAYGSTQVER